jgi:hypothetical protein
MAPEGQESRFHALGPEGILGYIKRPGSHRYTIHVLYPCKIFLGFSLYMLFEAKELNLFYDLFAFEGKFSPPRFFHFNFFFFKKSIALESP